MNQYRIDTVKCIVCGAQTNYHANWYLVVENRWLDQLKILSWHSWLAELPEMHTVCGDQHLRILVQHWLNEANLNLHYLDLHYMERTGNPALYEYRGRSDSHPLVAGRLLGELAVHRHPLSRAWTGSPQALECILTAITGRETRTRTADLSVAAVPAGRGEHLSRAHIAGWA